MRSRRRAALAASLLLALAGGLLLLRGTREASARASSAAAAQPGPTAPGAASPLPAGSGVLAPSPLLSAQEQQALVAALRSRYGPKLASPLTQVKLIEALVREFRGRGGAWKEALLQTLRAAFPESYALLAARLEQWLGYEAWMQANGGDLQRLDPEERRANLWAQREALFGKEDAQAIWASELRNEQLTRALAQLDTAPGARLPERLQRYRQDLEEAYGEQAPAFLERHRQEVLDRFLELGSVQRELSALPAAQRTAQLREIREGLGMDAAALTRWDALDAQRDARWDVGARYMAERAALLQGTRGEEQAARLAALRERLFGAEAQTLAAEESSGFLRFEQPRRWGRN